MRAVAALAALAALACEEPAPPASDATLAAEAPRDPPEGEAMALGVPARTIHRARLEARGLSRMTEALRRRAIEGGRARSSPSYRELRARADELAGARVTYHGRVGLSRPAGTDLWIVALMTRREGERWVDPLYVLSVVEPPLSEGGTARFDGWVVGARTIGRHTLPLVIAFHVEPD